MSAVAALLVAGYVAANLFLRPAAQSQSALSTLLGMPEASLVVPDGHVLASYSHGPTSVVLGTSAAAFEYQAVGTELSGDDVLQFYASSLGARSWAGPKAEGTSLEGARAETWTKDGCAFTVEIEKPGKGGYPGESAYGLTYVATLTAPTG